ncbi:MAG TPA: P2 family phage major capsid protein [Sphingomonadaceae bacterium]|nr:P2 family phage major capsid protein [Sphingomonadaceae bacterium]
MWRQIRSGPSAPALSAAWVTAKQLARDVLLSTKKLGGLQAVRVPYFPAGKIAVTRLDNLSIYAQEGTERRAIIDQPDLDRVADFGSVNEAYVVEENGLMAVAENIVMAAKAEDAG